MSVIARKYWLCLAVMVAPWPAMATLGGTTGSITADATALAKRSDNGTQTRALIIPRDITPATEHRFKVKMFLTAEGTEVREYTFGDRVFALAWTGPSPPDLTQLLGDSHNAFDQQADAQRNDGVHTIRSSVSVDTDTLKIYSGGRSPNFQGLAYLPTSLPAGVSANDIR